MPIPSQSDWSRPTSPPKLADRPQQIPSNVSYPAQTPTGDTLSLQSLRLEDRLSRDATNETNEQTLKRLLSTRSAISTTSSFAERQQASTGDQTAFRKRGTGSVGIVFEHPGTICVYKFSLLDQSDKLWNNYLIGMRLQNTFLRNSSICGEVAVPQCLWFATAASPFWSRYRQQIPVSRSPREVLCMGRNFPLPQIIQNKIIDVFCQLDPAAREQAKNLVSNKDCLIRPYLGRVRVAGSQSRLRAFSPRNYKLHLDQVQFLGLDAEEYGTAMAKAMAIMHWDIGIDAADIEFVLGISPTEEGTIARPMNYDQLQGLTTKTDTYREVVIPNPNFKQRLVSLWLVDFDACKDISLDEAGVRQAVKAFVENEPYCPRQTVARNMEICYGGNFPPSIWPQAQHFSMRNPARQRCQAGFWPASPTHCPLKPHNSVVLNAAAGEGEMEGECVAVGVITGKAVPSGLTRHPVLDNHRSVEGVAGEVEVHGSESHMDHLRCAWL